MFGKLWREWHLRDLDTRIQRHGWTAIYVGDYETTPSWVYTLGFDETLGRPELIFFDVPQELANGLLHKAFADLKSGELTLEDGEPWIIEGDRYGVWRKVHPSQIDGPDLWLAAAVNRREKLTGRRAELEAFQLVVADDNARLPWEPGYNERLRMKQPALYLPAQDYGDVQLSPGDREALRVADERGWSIRLVDAPELKWAYTIGLADAGRPEMIAFLHSAHMAANILHETQAYLARGDLVLEDGLRWNDLGLDGCWRRVHESQYLALNVFFLTKLRHERRSGRREAVDAYQFFRPDQEGRYPWEPGCNRVVRDCQPMLFEPHHPDQLRRGPLAALMRM
jgi:hypothetical protein